MKRVAVSAVLILIILGFCISSTIFLNNYVDNISGTVTKISEYILNGERNSAAKLCRNVVDEYTDKENFLISCMHHDDLEQIPLTLKECEILLYYSDETGMILSELSKLQIILKDIKETNNISFFSIM